MRQTSPQILSPDSTGIVQAARFLRDGALVAFPTETVYGLGADACSGPAVAAIFDAKGRPSFNPLIVHLAQSDWARRYADWSELAERVADRFWPGPLSLVLPLKSGHNLSPLVTAGLPSVALRVPGHPTAQRLLDEFGSPVAAPSANPSGRISPTRADHVAMGLGNQVAAIVDDGPCSVGLESTIIGLDGPPRLLRPGGISHEELEHTLGQKILPAQTGAITAPGQMQSHYAPRARVRLNARSSKPGEVLLGFGPGKADLNLSATGDLREAAANLFEYLHKVDATGQPIAVASIPDVGLGRAINDRLRRAAAPR
ncbi:MAG: L-threonylcarbamoyladenylate synthase [Pseudomonadota bacterium]